ncbi:MAG: DUF2238 domain-containing protein [archaeon]
MEHTAELKKLRLILIITLSYILIFTFIAIIKRNYEFLYYTFFMSLMAFLLFRYHDKLYITPIIFIGLSMHGLLATLGNMVYINNIRLYDIWIIKSFFRYDNFVHLIGAFVITFIAFNILRSHLDERLRKNRALFTILLILISLGIGAFVEIVELQAVLLLNIGDKVGDYFNNAFDLLYNLFGSIIATLFIRFKNNF